MERRDEYSVFRQKKSNNEEVSMSEKRYVVRYQVEIVANDLFEAIDKAEKYDELELYEIKQIFLKGDVDE